MKKTSQKFKIAYVAVALLMIASLLSLSALAAASGTHTPVTGVTVSVSGATDNSMSGGAVTVTAKGSGGVFGYGASAKTATITVSNASGSTATISFDWTATSVNQLKIDGVVYSGTTGSFSKTLEKDASFTITIVTAKNATVNTLVMKKFAVVVLEESDVTFQYDNTLGSITVGGTSVASGTTQKIDNSIELVATAKSDAAFVGWVDTANNLCLSQEAKYILAPADDMTVKAVFTTSSSNAWFLADKCLVNDLTAACEKAESADNKTVVLAASGVLPNGNYTIPSDVTLLIPYNKDHALITSDMASYVTEVYEPLEEYRRLTLAAGAKINVEAGGVLCVGSRAYRQASGQNGAYGSIELEQDSEIIVDGTLYAWGYIFGDGLVTANTGSSVYQMLSAPDYPNSASTALDLKKGKVFPMRVYSWQNVEVPLTVKYGSTLYGFYHVYGSNAGNHPGTVKIFGTGTDAIFQMTKSGSEATASFSEGKQKIILKGEFALNSLSVTVTVYMLVTHTETISTSDAQGLPLPGHFDITFKSGAKVVSNENIIITKGAKITIEENATFDAKGKNLYVLDASDDPGPPASAGLAGYTVYLKDRYGIDYSKITEDATIIVNGTLKASGGFYTSNGGANIISTGNGKIEVTGTSTETSVVLKANQGGSTSITISPAKLKNADGSYVETSGGAAATTYYYNGLKWYIPNATLEGLTVEYRLEDYLWLNAYFTLKDVSVTQADVTNNKLTVNNGAELYVVNDKVYLMKKITAAQIPDDQTFIVTYNNGEEMIAAPFSANLADLKAKDDTSDSTKALIDKLLAYGEAAEDMFGNTDADGKVIYNDKKASVEKPNDVPTELTPFDAQKPSVSAGNVTVTRYGMTIGFDNCLQFIYGFNVSGLTTVTENGVQYLQNASGVKVAEIGLLYSTAAGELVAQKSSYAYVLYQNPALTADSGNLPEGVTPTNKPTDSTLTPSELATMLEDNDCYMITYNMVYADYSKSYNYRPYVLFADGSVAYGEQFAYSLATYIGNRLGSTTNPPADTEKNLLYATWDLRTAVATWLSAKGAQN